MARELTMKSMSIVMAGLLLALSWVWAGTARAADAADKPVHRNVKADEFEKLIKEPDTVILDVRTPKEYARDHLKGSVLINFGAKDFNDKVKQLDKSKTYLVYCAVGGRSSRACGKLDEYGFTKVVNLQGGIKAWEEAGKPVEK
jgi:phage shock protein E